MCQVLLLKLDDTVLDSYISHDTLRRCFHQINMNVLLLIDFFRSLDALLLYLFLNPCQGSLPSSHYLALNVREEHFLLLSANRNALFQILVDRLGLVSLIGANRVAVLC